MEYQRVSELSEDSRTTLLFSLLSTTHKVKPCPKKTIDWIGDLTRGYNSDGFSCFIMENEFLKISTNSLRAIFLDERVLEKLDPEPLRGRVKYHVEYKSKQYPIKQGVSAVTGCREQRSQQCTHKKPYSFSIH